MSAARRSRLLAAFATLSIALVAHPATAQLPAGVEAPKPTVPEIFTLMGQFVRIAYNNQGFVTLGYRMAQESVGEEWVLLEVGLTMRALGEGRHAQAGHLSIKTPDGSVIGLATQQQYAEAGYLRALNMRTRVVRDSINYFPVDATRACAIQFFANLGQPGRSSPTTRSS